MVWYEEEVSQLEKRVSNELDPHRQTGRPVAFYGSSSIRLWTTLAQDFPEYPTLNLGFGGSTLAACTWFFERVVLPAQPSALVFYAGDNDLGDNRHAEEVYLFFCALSEKVQRHLPGVPFSFLSIKASPARWHIADRIRFANDLIRREISRHPNHHYVDLFTPMLGPQGRPRPELFEADGLHLSREGYRLWHGVLRQHPEIFNDFFKPA